MILFAGRRQVFAGFSIYLCLLLLTMSALFFIRYLGSNLQAPQVIAEQLSPTVAKHGQLPIMFHVLLCLSAVIIVGKILGRLCECIGQPPVIGEVTAGILLGPSFLGFFAPSVTGLLIPPSSVDPAGIVSSSLKSIAQLGVVLYMFLVGLELDLVQLKHRARATIAISHASIAFPFVLGAALAILIYARFSENSVDFTAFALFCGIAMSITAFPVLARILTDRQLENTTLGNVALGCAAADDVTAWCLLAIVVGFANADLTRAAWVIGGTVAYIALMLVIIRPLLQSKLSVGQTGNQDISETTTSLLFVGILVCALTTEVIGIHSLFGAFLFGAIIPKNSRIGNAFSMRVKYPVSLLLLPAFFAYTGMRTQIGIVSGVENWIWCGVIIAVATLGKFGGTFVAARFSGESWRDAVALGALMNTRGLMELIVLNIGLDLGVITPLLFTIMVIMALVTTALTSPVLRIVIPHGRIASD